MDRRRYNLINSVTSNESLCISQAHSLSVQENTQNPHKILRDRASPGLFPTHKAGMGRFGLSRQQRTAEFGLNKPTLAAVGTHLVAQQKRLLHKHTEFVRFRFQQSGFKRFCSSAKALASSVYIRLSSFFIFFHLSPSITLMALQEKCLQYDQDKVLRNTLFHLSTFKNTKVKSGNNTHRRNKLCLNCVSDYLLILLVTIKQLRVLC